MFKPLERGVERKEKDDVDEWGDERVKHVESWPARPRGAQRVAESGACARKKCFLHYYPF